MELLSNDPTISHLIKNNSCFIAGGLNADNVGNLISAYKPYGVDVSSGLESSVGKRTIFNEKIFRKCKNIGKKITMKKINYKLFPDKNGRFAEFGGKYVSETLMSSFQSSKII